MLERGENNLINAATVNLSSSLVDVTVRKNCQIEKDGTSICPAAGKKDIGDRKSDSLPFYPDDVAKATSMLNLHYGCKVTLCRRCVDDV